MNNKSALTVHINKNRELFERSPLIYGHFLEHFHRQVYGGVYDPSSKFADEDGFRSDVIEALKEIQTPIIRWPGGCFVSSYHWKKAVGPTRTAVWDKSWRVEDPNTFGTDEFVKLCRKIGCEPYICTNAGTGTEEEMSDWVEYCNLKDEGEFAKMRIANGFPEPHNVKYWSIGNENWGAHELGAKDISVWGKLVWESAKLMNHVDPTISLSAAALSNIDWDLSMLKSAHRQLEWLSIHSYWDWIQTTNIPSGYEKCMFYTHTVSDSIRRTRGLLNALGLEKRIRIAYDEWNLRGWYHPKIHSAIPSASKEEYLYPRDGNDINSIYTMADAVFSACFLNECLRNADIVGMANFSPVVNTRGAIFTHKDGIVKRSTYYVFELYTKYMGDIVIDSYTEGSEKYHIDSEGVRGDIDCIDIVTTKNSSNGAVAVSLINKHISDAKTVTLHIGDREKVSVITLSGNSPDDYNDIDRNTVVPYENNDAILSEQDNELTLSLPAHSLNIVIVEPAK